MTNFVSSIWRTGTYDSHIGNDICPGPMIESQKDDEDDCWMSRPILLSCLVKKVKE